jgi:hypothetical protein
MAFCRKDGNIGGGFVARIFVCRGLAKMSSKTPGRIAYFRADQLRTEPMCSFRSL